jgi:hypothetical protein
MIMNKSIIVKYHGAPNLTIKKEYPVLSFTDSGNGYRCTIVDDLGKVVTLPAEDFERIPEYHWCIANRDTMWTEYPGAKNYCKGTILPVIHYQGYDWVYDETFECFYIKWRPHIVCELYTDKPFHGIFHPLTDEEYAELTKPLRAKGY